MPIFTLALLISNSYAGFNGRTQHSRANCVNNESITWDATRYWWLATASDHVNNSGEHHAIFSNSDEHNPLLTIEYTWRSAAVHWGEASPFDGWFVRGFHYMTWSVPVQPILLEQTNVIDCSIYDGWWDIPPDIGNNFATTNSNEYSLTNFNKQAKLLGLPAPDSGVTIVDYDPFIYPQKLKSQAVSARADIKSKGYVQSNTNQPQFLNSIKQRSVDEIAKFDNNHDVSDTHLKSSPNKIKLAFKFKRMSLKPTTNVIGFAAMGGWNDGWTGIREFFEDQSLGICALSANNYKLTHGAAQLMKDDVRYDVNKYPNTLLVEESIDKQFFYSIHWFTDNYMLDLECTNPRYSQTIKDELINMAKRIDQASIVE